MGNPKTNCKNCGRPVWGEGDYCSRPCQDEDLPAALGEAFGGCVVNLVALFIAVPLAGVSLVLLFLFALGAL